MDLSDTRLVVATAPGWSARLSLAYGRRGGGTVPTLRRHVGPLRVQKGFAPEGPEVWHQVVVHPPGGIAGGDALRIDVAAGPGAHALLTGPGAAKWYRGRRDGAIASQALSIDVAAGAAVEWLPPETIVFDGARARWSTIGRVADGGTLLLSELVSLGRPACGERFSRGELSGGVTLRAAGGEPLFLERMRLAGGDPLLDSPVGLAGRPLFGSLLAVSDRLDADGFAQRALEACRAALPAPAEAAVTRMGRVLVLRWRGDRADEGLALLRGAWAALRPLLLDRAATPPRIWAT